MEQTRNGQPPRRKFIGVHLHGAEEDPPSAEEVGFADRGGALGSDLRSCSLDVLGEFCQGPWLQWRGDGGIDLDGGNLDSVPAFAVWTLCHRQYAWPPRHEKD